MDANMHRCADCKAEAIVDNEIQFDTILIDDENGFRYVCEDCHREAARKAVAQDHDGFNAAEAAYMASGLSELFTVGECKKIVQALSLLGQEYKKDEESKGRDWVGSAERQRMLRLVRIFKSVADA